MPDSDNLFDLPPVPWQDERFEILHESGGVRIERILSCGHTTPPGGFYDQDDDEWVVLIQGEAEISFDDGSTRQLTAGEHILIRAHQRHRVSHTSIQPPCIWLAVHIVKGS